VAVNVGDNKKKFHNQELDAEKEIAGSLQMMI